MIEISVRLWKASICLAILMRSEERASFDWLSFNLMWRRWWASVDVYRTDKQRREGSGLSFCIKLPLFDIANNKVARTVHIMGEHPRGDRYEIKHLISGKIFGREFCQK